MNKYIMLPVMALSLVGCAASQPVIKAPPQTYNPIRPIQVDCQFGLAMATQLEYIIASPGEENSFWDPTFNQIHGTANREQRKASAKYVLWSIRTKCQGY